MRVLISLFLLLLTALPAYATIDKSVINDFKSYLKGLKDVAIDFVQEDTRGSKASGKLIISKPDKFRCNYYKPYPLLIVGNKTYVSVYDFDLEQLSRITRDENIFSFLLTNDIDLEKHFRIDEASSNDDESKIELYHSELDRKTIITLGQREKRLRSIIIYEPDDNVITLVVNKITPISHIENDLFSIRNPEIYGPPARLDNTSLEKKYKL